MIVLRIKMHMEDLLRLLMASVMSLQFHRQEKDILDHTNGKCHLCTLQSTCKPSCNIVMHLITLWNILMLIYQPTRLSVECH